MANRLLSVIVPTRNRQYYAARCAFQVLNNKDARIELVIRDNSDNNSLLSLLGDLVNDERLIYDYLPTQVSFVQNFSDAIGISSGEYICFIGDDDGINHEIIDFTKWMKKKGIDAAKPEILTFYRWPYPDPSESGKLQPGELIIKKFSWKVSKIDTKSAVIKYLKGGGGNYLEYNMAKPYHGIVNRSIYDKIKGMTGYYFGGLTPDIYGAVAISLLSKYCVAVDYPFTIPGECPKSGSADSRTGRHTGELSEAPHLYGHVSYSWNPLVPKFYSVETIWTDSALAAIVDLGMQKLLTSMNLGAFYLKLVRQYPKYFKMVKSAYFEVDKAGEIKHEKIRILSQAVYELRHGIQRKMVRLLQRRHETAQDSRFSNINDVEAAVEQLMITLKEKSIFPGILDTDPCINKEI